MNRLPPSLSQAQRLKKYSQEGHLTLDMMRVIMGRKRKKRLGQDHLHQRHPAQIFSPGATPQRMQETIIKLLEAWQRKRQQQHER